MLLQLEPIQKSFGAVRALEDGNLSVKPGEVHLLLGENGAGQVDFDENHRWYVPAGWRGDPVAGQAVRLRAPKEAAAMGVAHGAPGITGRSSGRHKDLATAWASHLKRMRRLTVVSPHVPQPELDKAGIAKAQSAEGAISRCAADYGRAPRDCFAGRTVHGGTGGVAHSSIGHRIGIDIMC